MVGFIPETLRRCMETRFNERVVSGKELKDVLLGEVVVYCWLVSTPAVIGFVVN